MSTYQIGKSVEDVQEIIKEQAKDIKVHKMSSNENPFGPSPQAIIAIQNNLPQLNNYPQRNDNLVTQALAEHFARGLTAKNFTTANGAVDLINLLEAASFKPNQSNSIVICPPCFGSYAASATLKGAKVIEHPLDPKTFALDSANLASSITADTRLVYVCNPNNPTGSYFDHASLIQILDSLPEHVTLVYDEVYYHFATQFTMPDAIQSVIDERNIIILHSFSKAYGLAGLRTGYAIASESTIEQLNKHKLTFQNDSLSSAAMRAALTDHDFLNKVISNNTVQRTWLFKKMAELNLDTYPSQANFICFKAPLGQSAKAITEQLLKFGIMVRPAFYLPNHIRVSVGIPLANQAFIAAVRQIINTATTDTSNKETV